MTGLSNLSRDDLALAHHRWHCTDNPDLCAADDADFDFADFVIEFGGEL
jgi:hypothetical protein